MSLNFIVLLLAFSLFPNGYSIFKYTWGLGTFLGPPTNVNCIFLHILPHFTCFFLLSPLYWYYIIGQCGLSLYCYWLVIPYIEQWTSIIRTKWCPISCEKWVLILSVIWVLILSVILMMCMRDWSCDADWFQLQQLAMTLI